MKIPARLISLRPATVRSLQMRHVAATRVLNYKPAPDLFPKTISTSTGTFRLFGSPPQLHPLQAGVPRPQMTPKNHPQWFEPTGRSAILVNGKDLDVIRQNALMSRMSSIPTFGYNRYTQYSRGNKYLSIFELALSGRLNPESISGGLAPVMDEYIPQIIGSFESVYEDIAVPSLTNRRGIHVEDIIRVHPDENIVQGIRSAAASIAQYNNPMHLTYVIVYTHGEAETLNVGLNEEEISHRELLEILDTIPGKKIVIMIACKSGNFVKMVQDHSRRTDYVAIASTSEDEMGINWQDDLFLNGLTARLLKAEPVSALQLRKVSTPNFLQEGQTPTIFMGFDTIL